MYIYHLGQPPSPTQSVIQAIPPLTPNPTPPRSLNLVPHSHIRRTCNDGKTFANAADVTKMNPSVMSPGFLKADGKVRIDPVLDKKLKDLLQKPEHSIMVRKKAIRVALVDLTGDKICKPQYAGYHSIEPIYSASTIKYAVVYAAYQLIFDLNVLTRSSNIKTYVTLKDDATKLWSALKCRPDLDWLITFDEKSTKVSISENLDKNLKWMIISSSDMAASELILRIGFEFIASAVWRSGLFHPARKGLWLANTFEAAPPPTHLNPACHKDVTPTFWARNPFARIPYKIYSNTLTALSAVTFFTLLAPGRLVNQRASMGIENLLKDGCYVPATAANVKVRAAKCGILERRALHDATLIEGPDGRYRYAFALLTTDPRFKDPVLPFQIPWPERNAFVLDLDRLIRENNP